MVGVCVVVCSGVSDFIVSYVWLVVFFFFFFFFYIFFFSSRRRHTRYIGDWSSDVCSSDLLTLTI